MLIKHISTDYKHILSIFNNNNTKIQNKGLLKYYVDAIKKNINASNTGYFNQFKFYSN